jgi:FSR family fosmidomycin resistance protein-like MFS transporter
MAILFALSISHMLNDVMQSLLPAVYPILKSRYALTFTQIGLITFTFQVTASLLQPLVGMATDRRPQPYSLAMSMVFTLFGLILLAMASHFVTILCAAALVGIGSSVFHPEASRIARLASGGKHGFAQSLFQVGGNAGTALGPLLAAFVVVPWGQPSLALFSVVALAAMVVLYGVGRWYHGHLRELRSRPKGNGTVPDNGLTTTQVVASIGILLMLIFSKYFYQVSLSNYYTFYLMDKFGLSIQSAQVYLFVFLGSVAVGTVAGGPLGDRIGFKRVIWGSILGVLPFTLILDGRVDRPPRIDPGVGVLGDHGLCPGTRSQSRGNHRGPVLRLRVRHRRHRRRSAGSDGRLDQHWHGLSDLRLPASHRTAGRVAAESGQAKACDLTLSGLPDRVWEPLESASRSPFGHSRTAGNPVLRALNSRLCGNVGMASRPEERNTN